MVVGYNTNVSDVGVEYCKTIFISYVLRDQLNAYGVMYINDIISEIQAADIKEVISLPTVLRVVNQLSRPMTFDVQVVKFVRDSYKLKITNTTFNSMPIGFELKFLILTKVNI